MKCIGFGEHRGRCGNETYDRSPYWCERCDKLRMEHISKQMDEIAERLKLQKK